MTDLQVVALLWGALAFGVDALLLFGVAERAREYAVERYLGIRAFVSLALFTVCAVLLVFHILTGVAT